MTGLAPLVEAADQLLSADLVPRAVVLVEGVSDQRAVLTLAVRRGRDLAAEGVAVLAMGGVTNVRRFLELFGPYGLGAQVTGLCDEQEADDFVRAGLADFFVCVADLEDELIRALGHPAVERVIERAHELRAFRTLQHQPAQLGRGTQAQLRRFMGSGGGRKIRYAPLLVEALDLTCVPQPLEQVLDYVSP